MDIRKLTQDKADNDAAQAKLKAEILQLATLTAATDDQKARLKAAEGEYDALVKAAVDLTDKLRIAEKFKAEEKAAGNPPKVVEVGVNRAEAQPVSFGEFLQAIAYQKLPSLAADHGYEMSDALKAAVSGASAGVSADGGVLIRNEWSTELLNKARETSQLLSKCDVKEIGAGFDAFEAPYIDETSRATGSRWGGVQVYRSAEAASVTNTQPKLGKFELRLEELKGLFYATQRLLRDATALQSIAEDAFASEFAFKIDDELVRGDGNGRCQGVIGAPCTVQQAKVSGQANDTVKAENIIAMYSRMHPAWMSGAEWYVNVECLPELQKMSVAVGTAGGQLVYMPPGGLSQAPYGTLLGRPVNVIEQASGLGDVGDIMFLNLKAMLVIQKAMTSASSEHVRFIFDEMTFKWTWPIIGKPKLAAAITPYKATTATTLSPFVTLQAR